MKLYRFKLLNSHSGKISHAVTSRHGGSNSDMPFDSLNLAYHVDDKRERVKANRDSLAAELGYEEKRAVYMNQVHGKKIEIIRQNHCRSSTFSCDGIVTDQKNTPLVVMVADCIPILLFDPLKNVIGAVHAGRSGLFKNIIKEAIESFKSEFESSQKDIIAALGPSIHACCYEVGKEIFDEAKKLGFKECVSIKKGRYFLDNVKMAKKQLLDTGIKEENIEEMDICTSCHTEDFFSYRRENQKTGRTEERKKKNRSTTPLPMYLEN